jgi:hypothetical protein
VSSRASVTVYNRCTVHLGLLLHSMFLAFTGELIGAARESIRLTLTLLLIMLMMTMIQCCAFGCGGQNKMDADQKQTNVCQVSLPHIACMGFSVCLVSVSHRYVDLLLLFQSIFMWNRFPNSVLVLTTIADADFEIRHLLSGLSLIVNTLISSEK